ncbi:MAG: hypothetical protein WCF33_13185 [Pseudonocardiaceae bacterium]
MAEQRRGGLARLPDFGTSAEDRLLGSPAPAPDLTASPSDIRGASGAPAVERQHPRRRPLKVDESLADQLRDAVLFMRGRGQPELTQNELLDELLAKGLQWLRDEENGGKQFPSTQRRRAGAR